MIDKLDKKIILGNLIPAILEDETNLQNFIFFLNRLENIRRPGDEILSVLKDYLCICENIPVKGKRKIKHIDDRHVLYCKENLGFIDAYKIETIANAVLNKTEVKLIISIDDFKRKYRENILSNDKWGEKYRDIINKYQENDEIIEFISPRWTWKQLCGRSFVVLERDGTAVTAIRKSMN